MNINLPQEVLYDTALSKSRYSVVVLKELVDPTHILFGSDFPFAPATLLSMECRTISEVRLWSDKEQYGIDRGHALNLFPKSMVSLETIAPKPVFEKDSIGNKILKVTSKIAVQLLSRLQN